MRPRNCGAFDAPRRMGGIMPSTFQGYTRWTGAPSAMLTRFWAGTSDRTDSCAPYGSARTDTPMDIQDTPSGPTERSEERDTDWAEMNERLRALQDKYAKARVDSEPRSFATRFRT